MGYESARFADYCKKNICFDDAPSYEYNSLSVCIVDCVYSLRTKYTTTEKVVQCYCDYFLDGDKQSDGMTISEMVGMFDKLETRSDFADIVQNKQKLGNPPIPKEEICYKLARYLKCLNIETIQDFNHFPEQELLEAVVRSVKGIGVAGSNYLFMLAGDQDRCKPDVHIHRCLRDVYGKEVDDADCQRIFAEAVDILKVDYPFITVRALDGMIWRKYSNWKY